MDMWDAVIPKSLYIASLRVGHQSGTDVMDRCAFRWSQGFTSSKITPSDEGFALNNMPYPTTGTGHVWYSIVSKFVFSDLRLVPVREGLQESHNGGFSIRIQLEVPYGQTFEQLIIEVPVHLGRRLAHLGDIPDVVEANHFFQGLEDPVVHIRLRESSFRSS
jgi:hypothetical protein